MAKIHTINTGSQGNCYLLMADGKVLIIECGVPYQDIAHSLNCDFGCVVGCAWSHGHIDHLNPSTAKKLAERGVEIFADAQHKQRFSVGGFTILPLEVKHGDCPNMAYVIDTPDKQRILFATDLEDFPYHVKGLTAMVIEANYSQQILDKAVLRGCNVHSRSYDHMEIGRTCEVIKRHLSPTLTDVVLIHMSAAFGDSKAFVKQVREITEQESYALNIYAAKPNTTININESPF